MRRKWWILLIIAVLLTVTTGWAAPAPEMQPIQPQSFGTHEVSDASGQHRIAGLPGVSDASEPHRNAGLPGVADASGLPQPASLPGVADASGWPQSASLPGVADASGLPQPASFPGVADASGLPPDIRRALPGADVIIDAGHGGIDGGTHWGELKESDINLAISRKLYLLLRSKGIRAVLNRTGDYALSDENRWHITRSRHQRDLSQRGSLQDEIEAGMLVSIHVNWSSNKGRRGPLTLYRRDDGRSAILAFFVQDALNRQQNTRYLPKPAGSYYLLNRAKIPSVIVETAFISNEADRKMLTSRRGQTKIAEAIAAGIIAYRIFDP